MDQHVQDELDLGLLYTTLRNSPTPSPQRLLATSEVDPGASASSSPSSSSSSSSTSISPSLPLDPETSYSHLCSLVFFGYLSPRPTRIFRIPFLGVEPSEVPEAALPLLLQPSIVTSSAHDRVVCALAQAHPPLAYAPQVSSIVLVLLQQLQWKEARAFGAASALIHQSRGALQTLVEEASRASCGEGGEGGEGEGGALLSSTTLPMPWLHLTRDFEAAYIRVFRALLRSSSERLSNHLEGLPSSSSSVSTRGGGGGGGGGGSGGRTLKHLLGEMFSGCLSGFLPPSDLGRFIDHFCHPRGGPVFMLRVALTMVLSVKGALLGAKDCGEVDRILRVWVATGAAIPATSPAAPTTNTTTTTATLLLPGTAYPYSWEALLDALGGEGAPDLPPHLLPTLLIRQDSAVVKSGVGVGWAGAAIAAGLVSPPSSPTTTPFGVAAAAAAAGAPSGVWRGATWHNPAIVAKLPPGWVRDLVVARRGEGGGPPSPAGKGDISPTFRRTHSHPGLARALKRFCGGRLCTPDFSLPPLTRAANSSSSRGGRVGWVKKGGRGEEEEKMEEEEEEEEEERVGELLRASLANLPLPWPRQPHFFYQQQLNGSSTSSIKSRSASGGSKGDDEVGGSSLTLSTLPSSSSSSSSTATSRDYYTPLWPLATLPTPASLLALLPPLAKDVNWCLQHSSDWVQQQQQLSGGGGVGRLVAALPQGGEPFVAFFSLELGTPLGGGDEPPLTPSSSPSFSSQSRPIFGVYCGGGIPPPGVPPPHTPPYTWLKAEPGDLAFQYLPDLAALHWNAAAAFPTPPPPPAAAAAAVVPLPAAGEGNLTSPSRFVLDPARFAVTAQRVVMSGGGGEGRGDKSPTAPPPPPAPTAALALFGCSTGGGSHFVVWDEDEERESTGGGGGGEWCHAAASPALLSALGVPIPSRLLQQCAGGGVAGGVRVGPGWVGGDGVGIFSAPIRVKVGVVEVYSFTAPPPVDGGFGE